MLISYGKVIFDDVTGDVYEIEDDCEDDDGDVDYQVDREIERRHGLD